MISEILSKHAYLFEQIGVSYQKIYPYLNQNTFDSPITKNIHLTEKDKGKVFVYIKQFTANNGQQHAVFTVGTHRNGGDKITFNTLDLLKESRDNFNQKPTITISPKDNVENFNKKALDAEQASKTKKLLDAHKLWANSTNESIATHPYALKKGIYIEGIDIRRGVHSLYGDCLIIPCQSISGEITAYQYISTAGEKRFVGKIKNSFVVIGDKNLIKSGAFFCEGVWTGLSIYHANGKDSNKLNNSAKLPVIVCLNCNGLKDVTGLFKKEGVENITICADNDVNNKTGTNVGIYSAIEAAEVTGSKLLYPISDNGLKCDFNDTLSYQEIVLAKNRVDKILQLIDYAQTNKIEGLIQNLAFALVKDYPLKNSKEEIIFKINAAMAKRKFKSKISITNLIDKLIKNILKKINKNNRVSEQICKDLDINAYNVDGLETNQIAGLIKSKSLESENGAIWFDNRGMGGDKTNTMVALSKLIDENKAYITHRVSLVKDASQRLKFEDYQDVKFLSSKKEIDLTLCVNSINNFDVSTHFKVLFIDEARQVLEHVLNGSVEKRSTVYEKLILAVKNANLIIVSDADLNDFTVEFFNKHKNGKSLNIIKQKPKEDNKNYISLSSHDEARQRILKDLMNGKRGVVASTSENQGDQTYKHLIENGINKDRILLIKSENKGDIAQKSFLAKPTEEAKKYDCVIYTPVIGSGVSIEFSAFEFTYLLNSPVIPSNEVSQMFARNRCAKNVYVSFGKRNNLNLPDNIKTLKQGAYEQYLNYASEIGMVTNEFILNELGLMKLELLSKINYDLNDYQNNFLLFNELHGRNFVKLNSSENSKIDGLKERVTEEKIEKIYTAKVINDNEYRELENKYSKTQAESNEVSRFDVLKMVGKEEITKDDVKNYLNGDLSILLNFELLSASLNDLKMKDKANFLTKDKHKSLSSLQKIFKELLEVGKDKDINAKVAMKFCLKLKKYSAELAANGYQDFSKHQFKNPTAVMNNFLEKIGYELKQKGQENNVKRTRFYELKIIERISLYASNREALRDNFYVRDELFFLNKKDLSAYVN
jgi:phage/plasmid primase-like uncharacterized protein